MYRRAHGLLARHEEGVSTEYPFDLDDWEAAVGSSVLSGGSNGLHITEGTDGIHTYVRYKPLAARSKVFLQGRAKVIAGVWHGLALHGSLGIDDFVRPWLSVARSSGELAVLNDVVDTAVVTPSFASSSVPAKAQNTLYRQSVWADGADVAMHDFHAGVTISGASPNHTSGFVGVNGSDSTQHQWWTFYAMTDRYITVEGIPAGGSAEVQDGGGATLASAAEAGGTALIDMLDVVLPGVAVVIKDSGGVVVESLTATDGVWGGDEFVAGAAPAADTGLLKQQTGLLHQDDFNRPDAATWGEDYANENNVSIVSGWGRVGILASNTPGNVDIPGVDAINGAVYESLWKPLNDRGGNARCEFRWNKGGTQSLMRYLIESINTSTIEARLYSDGGYTGWGTQGETGSGQEQAMKGSFNRDEMIMRGWRFRGLSQDLKTPDIVREVATAPEDGAAYMGSWHENVHEYRELRIYRSHYITVTDGVPVGGVVEVLNDVGTVVGRGREDGAGGAVIDMMIRSFPMGGFTSLRTLDGSGVVVETLTPADGVWGGDVYAMPSAIMATGEQRITIFEGDDITPITDRDGVEYGAVDAEGNVTEPTAGTYSTAARPYLHAMDDVGGGAVDLLRGKSDIEEMQIRILDRRRVASDQDTGWFTYLLANLSGRTNLIGRRVLVEEYRSDVGWEPMMNAVITDIRMAPNLVDYEISIRDVRERSRRANLFSRAFTTTIVPRGILDGWGTKPNGEKVVPPTQPKTGTVSIPADDFQRHIAIDEHFDLDDEQHKTLTEFVHEGYEPYSFGQPWPERYRIISRRHLRFYWRVAGSGDPWTDAGAIFNLQSDILHWYREGDITRRVFRGFWVQQATEDLAKLPADGASIEWIIGTATRPSEKTPLHIESTMGQFLVDVLDGEYSPDADGEPVPMGLPYNETEILAYEEPVLGKITKPVGEDQPDARRKVLDWLEKNLLQPRGAALAMDDFGRLTIISYDIPPDGEVLPSLDDGDVDPETVTWEQTGDAITKVQFTFMEHIYYPPDVMPGDDLPVDRVVSREITLNFYPGSDEVAVEEIYGLVGEQVLEINTQLFSSLSVSPSAYDPDFVLQVLQSQAALFAAARADQAFDRYLLGSQMVSARVGFTEAAGLRIGSWLTGSVSWLPNYTTGERSLNRLLQIEDIKRHRGGFKTLLMVDAGPDLQPVGQPTLGVASIDDGRVVIPVTALPAGVDGRVQYAVSATQPSSTSGLWKEAGIVRSTDTLPVDVTTPKLPSGLSVWYRARGQAVGRRASAWTAPVNIINAEWAEILDLTLVADPDAGTVTATWSVSADTDGIRFYLYRHDPDDDPDIAGGPDETLDVDATAGTAVFTEAQVGALGALTVDAEPWTGFSAGSVAGTAGEPIRRAVFTPILGLVPEVEIQLSAPSDEIARLDVVDVNAGVAAWSAWMRKGGWPTQDGTSTGILVDDYLVVDSSPISEQSVERVSTSTDQWYAIVVPYDVEGEAGERATTSLDVGGVPAGDPALSNVQVHGESTVPGGAIYLTWEHNQAIEDDAGATFGVTIARKLDGGLATQLVAGRNPTLERDGNNAVVLEGGFTDPYLERVAKTSSNDPNWHKIEYIITLTGGTQTLKYTAVRYDWVREVIA